MSKRFGPRRQPFFPSPARAASACAPRSTARGFSLGSHRSGVCNRNRQWKSPARTVPAADDLRTQIRFGSGKIKMNPRPYRRRGICPALSFSTTLATLTNKKRGATRPFLFLFRLSRVHGARLRYARGTSAFPRASSGDARYVSSSCCKLCRQDQAFFSRNVYSPLASLDSSSWLPVCLANA